MAVKCKADGTCLDDVCEPCFDFRLILSGTAGALAAYRNIVQAIEIRAGKAFAERRDGTAHVLRELADEIRRDFQDPAEKDLSKYNRESEK